MTALETLHSAGGETSTPMESFVEVTEEMHKFALPGLPDNIVKAIAPHNLTWSRIRRVDPLEDISFRGSSPERTVIVTVSRPYTQGRFINVAGIDQQGNAIATHYDPQRGWDDSQSVLSSPFNN